MGSIGPNKLALRQAFQKGRRAGIWLAKYGPTIQAENRKKDVGVMRGQDKALEGLGDVFERAETEAERKAQRRAEIKAERTIRIQAQIKNDIKKLREAKKAKALAEQSS